MSQNIFKNPYVSDPIVLTGTGNGSLTINKLTHFTITQTYTVICTAISPFTVFSVVGSVDGAVGTAVVGNEFSDEMMKIFLTIEQGPTPFIIGDRFNFGVTSGTDVTQENIDSYDALPQKNFSAGTVNTNSGDDNFRFSASSKLALLQEQDLKFESKLAGLLGNQLKIKYVNGTLGVSVEDNRIITVTFESGVTTASAIKAAVEGNTDANALVTVTIVGTGSNAQVAPLSSLLRGGQDANTYATNANEISAASSFHEGNANASIQKLNVQEELDVNGDIKSYGKLVLDDLEHTANVSGPSISNVQALLNGLEQNQNLVINSVADDLISWEASSLSFAQNIQIRFKDTGITNTIQSSNSPITIADGESVYVTLNRYSSVDVTPVVVTSLPYNINTLRLVTRVGDNLVWFNGVLTSNHKLFRLGSISDYHNQIFTIFAGTSTINANGTTGVIEWTENILIKALGSSAKITIEPSDVTLADDEVAYIVIPEDIVEATLTMQIAARSSVVLQKPTTFWLFHRSGNEIVYRNGTSGGGGTPIQEVPSGTIDGTNDTFTLTEQPVDQDHVFVYVDGIVIDKANWSLVNKDIIFDLGFVPASGQDVYAIYFINGGAGGGGGGGGSTTFTPETEYRTIAAGEITAKKLTLAHTPLYPSKVLCDVLEGTFQKYGSDFTVSSNELSWDGLGLEADLEEASELRIHYFY